MKNNGTLVPYSSRFGTSRMENDLIGSLDRMFDSFWNEPAFLLERNWRPTDINQDNDNYYINIELPGFKKAQINITTQGNVLKISAKNNRSSYERQFSISGWDLPQVKSKLEDGILGIIVPKTPEAKEKTIEIEEVKTLSDSDQTDQTKSTK